MHFSLDENVPHSVARVLTRNGHSVDFVVDILPRGAADPIVATLSEEIGAILVSADNDFKSIAPRIHIGRGWYRRLSRIALLCGEPQAAQRIDKAMSLVEAEFEIAQQSADNRMIIAIGKSYIRTER